MSLTPALNNGLKITYFANKADADANLLDGNGDPTANIGSSSSYVVGSGFGPPGTGIGDTQAVNPYVFWAVSNSSVGASSSICKTGGTLNAALPDGSSLDAATYCASYLLYPVNIVYFLDALNAVNSTATGWNTENYTVATYSDGALPAAPNGWVVIPWSTGPSSKTVSYTADANLDTLGTYGLYPYNQALDLYPVLNESCLTYFANKSDADTFQNTIGNTTTQSYVIGTGSGSPLITGDPNALNPYKFWAVSNSSIGSSPPSIYKVGYELSKNDSSYNLALNINLSGLAASYFLYPVKIVYFSTLNEALTIQVSAMCWNFDNYTIGTISGDSNPYPTSITKWKIAPNSTGTDSQTGYYNTGDTLTGVGTYILYPYTSSIACFIEGTQILCQVDGQDSYIPIETMKPGSLVKTPLSGYKKVEVIGKRIIENPAHDDRIEERLYKCSPNNYPELKNDLFITGCHSILVNNITDAQREKTIKSQGRVFITDKKYRLMAVLDEKATPWVSEGKYTIWHFALEHTDLRVNYGVYANGLLVESSSIRYMKNYSKMDLIK